MSVQENQCPVCGHPREEFHCGTPGVALLDVNQYICYCPTPLLLHSFDDAVAALAKLQGWLK